VAQILFIAEIPPNDSLSTEAVYSSRWRDFLKAAGENESSAKDGTRILEGSWLLDAGGGWQRANTLTNAADRCQIPYRVFLVEGAVTRLTKR